MAKMVKKEYEDNAEKAGGHDGTTTLTTSRWRRPKEKTEEDGPRSGPEVE